MYYIIGFHSLHAVDYLPMTMGRVTEGHLPSTQWRLELIGRAYAGRYYGPSSTTTMRTLCPTPSHQVLLSIGVPPMLIAIGPPALDLPDCGRGGNHRFYLEACALLLF